MTKPFAIICVAGCLMLSGCGTNAPKPPTPPLIVERATACPLVPCLLPARKAPATNEDWAVALDVTEGALLSCAVQVQECIARQKNPVDSGE